MFLNRDTKLAQGSGVTDEFLKQKLASLLCVRFPVLKTEFLDNGVNIPILVLVKEMDYTML